MGDIDVVAAGAAPAVPTERGRRAAAGEEAAARWSAAWRAFVDGAVRWYGARCLAGEGPEPLLRDPR